MNSGPAISNQRVAVFRAIDIIGQVLQPPPDSNSEGVHIAEDHHVGLKLLSETGNDLRYFDFSSSPRRSPARSFKNGV